MVFLIDYENVTSAGIEGIDKLSEQDSVYIFYTAAQQSISFDMHRAILDAKCKISYFSVANGGKNALDFQLASFIGYLVGLSEDKSIYVVSGDKGFQFIWKFWERQGVEGLSIFTVPSILKALKHDRLLSDSVSKPHTLDELVFQSVPSVKEEAPAPVEEAPAEPVKPARINDEELFAQLEEVNNFAAVHEEEKVSDDSYLPEELRLSSRTEEIPAPASEEKPAKKVTRKTVTRKSTPRGTRSKSSKKDDKSAEEAQAKAN
ncbi:MAG: hypothetical protein K6G68_08795 [Oscillospiraceae bacterium]|nr:hypothetical protein [Oscillospiraceae bacterium]